MNRQRNNHSIIIRRIVTMALTCACALLSAQDKTTVYRNGNNLLVRSAFSTEKDIVIKVFNNANESAYLIPKNAKITEYAKKGILIHRNPDEYAATHFGPFGFLSGNHGSPFARILHFPAHGMTAKSLGTKLTEKDGYAYRIIQIVDNDHILIHPEGSGDTRKPKLKGHKNKKLFHNGKEIKYLKSQFVQMYPLNRITEFQFLINGKTPLADKTEVQCDFIDHVFTHDVISPLAVIEWFKNNPGRKLKPEFTGKWKMAFVTTGKERAKYQDYMKLDSLATYHNLYRYEPYGASVLYRKAVYHAKLSRVDSFDIMFGWSGEIAKKKNEEFYIPKLKPLRIKGYMDAPDLDCDFSAIYKMPKSMMVNYVINKKDCLNPQDMPDRFIRITGNKERQLGIAIGYSLFMGCTAKVNKSAERKMAYYLWRSKKMYPYAYTLRNIEPGKTMETVAYKQYFNPKIEPDSTAFYYHKEGDSYVIYLDFHKKLKNKIIKLPEHFAGKKITAIEQTPSVILHTAKTVPEQGINLSVNDKYGYIVLKLD